MKHVLTVKYPRDMSLNSIFVLKERTCAPEILTDCSIIASIVLALRTGKSANQEDGYGQESGHWNFEPIWQQLRKTHAGFLPRPVYGRRNNRDGNIEEKEAEGDSEPEEEWFEPSSV